MLRRLRFRRALRHAFTILSALSLLLCVAVCVLWVRSYRISDSFDKYALDPGRPPKFEEVYGVFTRPGAVGLGYVRLDYPNQQSWPHMNTPWRWNQNAPLTSVYKRQWALLGFERWDERWPPRAVSFGGGVARGFQIPLWAIALLFAVAPVVWLKRADLRSRLNRRLQSGLCPACGYDLRAHRANEHCPECGNAVQKAA